MRSLSQLVIFAAIAAIAASTGCRSLERESYEQGLEAYERGDFDEALRIWHPLAEAGYMRAQARLGVMYFNGEGVARDAREAVSYWTEAAAQGSLEAKIGLGNAYASGRGIERNLEVAVRWWRMAAERGHVDAQVGLGNAYVNGHGVEQDFAEAERWWKKAAAQGSEEAKYGLGTMYLGELEGLEGEPSEGVELLGELAANEHADAQYFLGLIYRAGGVVERDEARSRELFEAAAAQGHDEAAARLRRLDEASAR